ncbi:MAG: M56 family metallopeptidase [Candidatus Aminicenantales bacterium]
MAGLAECPWLSLFFEYLIKSSIALALGGLLTAIFRRGSASLRHFILSLFLIGLLLLPLLSSLRIGWETRLLPSRTTRLDVMFTSERIHKEISDSSPGLSNALSLSDSPDAIQSASRPSSAHRLTAAGRIFESAFPIIWSVGLIIFIVRVAVGLLGAFRLTREGETVHDPLWRILLERFLVTIHLKRTVRLKSHQEVLLPLTWGFFRPVVLIPASFEDWTEDQRSSALFHELSHVKRADFLVMVLVRLSLAVFWFNPLSWVVFRLLKKEQEKACDELVLKAGIKPSTYAANLLFFRRSASFSWNNVSAGLLGMIEKSPLNERLAAILKQKLTFKEVQMKTKITFLIAFIFVLGFIGMARPSATVADENSSSIVTEAAAIEMLSSPRDAVVSHAEETKQDQTVREDQKKEEEKKEVKKHKHTIIVTTKEGKKLPIEILITEGDTTQTLRIMVDNPILIKEGAKGKVLIVSTEGKELKVLEGDKVTLEIKSDKLEIVKEGKVLKIDADKPHVLIKDGKKGESRIAWVVKEDEGELLEKLHELREKLKDVKEEKLDIQEVEKALEKLEEKLKEHKETSKVHLMVKENPAVFTVVKKKGDDPSVKEIFIGEDSKKHFFTIIANKKGFFSLMYRVGPGEKSREMYEKTVEKVKKELPEGFTIEPGFDEDSGMVTLKIKGPIDKGTPRELIQKLVDRIKEELTETK